MKKLSRYVASLPERTLRATVGTVAGTTKAVTLLLPRSFRKTQLFRHLVDPTLRFLIENVGDVQGAYRTDPAHDGADFVKRRAVGNAIEAVGLLQIHASPVWILAALSDVCGVGRALIPEIADALKANGLLDPGTHFTSVDELLEGLERTSSRLAGNLNMPPLDIASLKQELAGLRADARGMVPGRLPSGDSVKALWRQIADEAKHQDTSVFQATSLMAIHAAKQVPQGARWLRDATVVGAARTGQLTYQVIFDDYRASLAELRERGFSAAARTEIAPYVQAAMGHFDREKKTLTDRAIDRFGG